MDNLVLEGKHYCRCSNKNRIALENRLISAYKLSDNYRAAILPSGLAAIAACLSVLSRDKKIRVMISNELYSETPDLAIYFANEIVRVDIWDDKSILDKIDDIDVFLFEACSNPSGYMFNFEILKQFPKHVKIICDNTWLSPILFNPIEHGAHILVESMTKYISGGRCIGGHVISEKRFMAEIYFYISIHGLFIGSDHCQLFLDGLETMKKRVTHTSNLTMEIARYLKDRIEVTYPLLENHKTHSVAKKYLGNLGKGPSVLLFKPTNKMKLEWKTSFGSAETKFEQCGDGWIRMAVGYESTKTGIILQLNI